MRTGGSFAIQGIRSWRDKRLRDTTLPLSSIPTACNTRLAISIPRTCISCFMGLASCGSMSSLLWNSLWLIAVDPHRGGSISLRPDHRGVKRATRPMLGFKAFDAAQSTLTGIELMHMLRKGQLAGGREAGRSAAEQFYALA